MALPQDSYLRFGPYLDLMTGVRTALNINEGIIKVVAPEGCGKTALCRTLAHDLKAEGKDVIFFETPPESVAFLHQRIQTELDLPRDKNFTRSLTSYLLGKSPPDNKLTIIYDDAEKISKDIFILIRLLNNIHDQSETLVAQVICGTGKLDRVFDDPDLRSLTQYLNQSFTLEPMTRDALEDFYSGYRKLAGITGPDLTNKEMTDLYIRSKGLPGKAFELLERHFSGSPAGVVADVAETQEAPQVADHPAPEPASGGSVSHYAREVDAILDEDESATSRAPMYFKAALSLVVVGATLFLAFILSGDTGTTNTRLDRILADDSPLYLDEVDPENAVAITGAEISVPVVNGGQDSAPVAADEPVPEPAPAESAALTIAGAESVPDAADAAQPLTDPVADLPEQAQETVATAPADTAGESLPEAPTGEPAPQELPPVEVAANDTEGEAPADESAADTPAPEDPPVADMLGREIEEWLEAWQGGNYPDYLSAYHPDFESPYHDSREAWESERESRVAGVTGIAVSHDRLEVMAATDREATVRFWLYYSRGNYADETLKEIVFRRDDGDWQIYSERNLELIVR